MLLAVFNFSLSDASGRCAVGNGAISCREVFNTDRIQFGGKGRVPKGGVVLPENGELSLHIPAMTAIFFHVDFEE